jgi:predicted dehydrogenase
MASSRKVRYAVVGLGNISQVAVLPAFANAENSELVALISGDEEKRERLSERYPDVEATGSYDELESVLEACRVDAAYVAVPNTMHREMMERIAGRYVHVLCEKPMATTVEDCRAMIEAAQRNEIKLMIAYRLHFEEASLRTVELLRSGKIGDPRIFSSVFTHQVREGDIRTSEELGGGALFDMGIYCINAARNLFADEPIEVFAFQTSGGDPRAREVDQTTSALLRFPGDRIAQLTASQGAATVSSYRVVGTNGSVRVEPGYEYATGLKRVIAIGENQQHVELPKRDQFAPELVYFSNCILDDLEPEPSGEEGLADVRVMCALIESASRKTPLVLGPFARRRRPGLDQMISRPGIEPPETVHAPPPSTG